MKLLRKLYNYIFSSQSEEDALYDFLGIDRSKKRVLSEITYFACLKMLSETLGKMPIKYFKDSPNGTVKAENDDIYELLRTRPNKYMTPSIFWSTIENNRNHYGNAYVWIRREFIKGKYGGKLTTKDLWILPSENVQIYMDNKGIFADKGILWYVYTDPVSGEQHFYRNDEIMHFKTSTTFDGIVGMPVKDILALTIDGSLESQSFMNNLYKTGLTSTVAMNYTGDLSETKVEKLVSKLKKYAMGASNANGFIPVPPGVQLQPLSVKLTDAQFLELKKYSALQIASAFGIKPNQINDYEKSSYSNSEMQQLSFYVDTELYIIKHYEEEMKYKLLSEAEIKQGKYFKFNEKVLLRADSKTQGEVLSKYVNNGIYTPNEAREYLDMPKCEGGDQLIVNGNYIPITKVGTQYVKGGDNNE